MQSLLIAVGMTAVHAAPAAAAFTWILKDLVGQVGGALLASRVGHHFDAQLRLHRLKATRLNIAASSLELLTPLFPALFVPIGAVANMMKNVSWLATAATRAAAHLTFASRANLGDITGKAGAQATAAGVLGTTLGAWISYVLAQSDDDGDDGDKAKQEQGKDKDAETSAAQAAVPGSSLSQVWPSWLAFALLSVLSYRSTRTALRTVISHTLDRQRTDILVSQAFRPTHARAKPATGAQKRVPVVTAASVASEEVYNDRYVPIHAARAQLYVNRYRDHAPWWSAAATSLLDKLNISSELKKNFSPSSGAAVPSWAVALGPDAARAAPLLRLYADEAHVLRIDGVILLEQPEADADADGDVSASESLVNNPLTTTSAALAARSARSLARTSAQLWARNMAARLSGTAEGCTVVQAPATELKPQPMAVSEFVEHRLQGSTHASPNGYAAVNVWMRRDASNEDVFRAYVHALVAKELLLRQRGLAGDDAVWGHCAGMLAGGSRSGAALRLVGADNDAIGEMSLRLCRAGVWERVMEVVNANGWDMGSLYLADGEGYVDLEPAQRAVQNKNTTE
jgi:hypothetical protein